MAARKQTELEKYLTDLRSKGTVEIRPISNATWGIKGKDNRFLALYNDCKSVWCPGISKRTGQYTTGLGAVEGLQEYMEKQFGYEEGFLSPRNNNEFWAGYHITVYGGRKTELDLNTDRGLLDYIVFTADDRVAPSLKKADNNNAFDYYITREIEEVQDKNVKNQVIATAFAEMAGLTASQKSDVMYMLGKGAENTNTELIDSILFDTIKTHDGASKFVSIVNDPMFEDKVNIYKYVRRGVIKKLTGRGGTSQGYAYGDSNLGASIEDVVIFLNNSKNENVKASIREDYNDRG